MIDFAIPLYEHQGGQWIPFDDPSIDGFPEISKSLIEVHIRTNDHFTQFTNFLIATIDLHFMLKAAVLWQVGLFITKFKENLNTTNDDKFNILHEQSLYC